VNGKKCSENLELTAGRIVTENLITNTQNCGHGIISCRQRLIQCIKVDIEQVTLIPPKHNAVNPEHSHVNKGPKVKISEIEIVGNESLE
jgi:hypothetical protein